ncbi:chitin-binding protein [Mycolicibacterium tokaiense]|uniref:Chitin-binding protein n=1 Tax=Mycolicibacterium tokaiense TaxID=39695 RepID=A0A378TDS8_9MYCO|nr:chitin-binding protein [Mycolicibacterium tokaiense]BBY86830.1 hypothetical protein MTOK_26120 [Mycolicibacterium tokaiense]STZ58664.1 chitin-binding protein [Mycolicibacterium tokaiense]
MYHRTTTDNLKRAALVAITTAGIGLGALGIGPALANAAPPGGGCPGPACVQPPGAPPGPGGPPGHPGPPGPGGPGRPGPGGPWDGPGPHGGPGEFGPPPPPPPSAAEPGHWGFRGAPWGEGPAPWGWGPPPRPSWDRPLPPPGGYWNAGAINYWGYDVTPVWNPGFNQWGFWLFGAWIAL